MERDVSGRSGKVSIIVAAAVALASLISLVASCLSKLFRLGFQQFVECFLDAAPD